MHKRKRHKMEKADIKGKRVLAIDYGMKRIGIAVCDEFHITTRPVATLQNDEKTLDKLAEIVKSERAGAFVLGVPVRNDSKNDAFIEEIKNFAEKISKLFNLQYYFCDEYLSSRRAMASMVENGKGRRKRGTKGETDKIAAAIILRDFLSENENA